MKVIYVTFCLLLIGCSTSMMKNTKKSKAVNLNSYASEFQNIDEDNDGVVSKKEFEKLEINEHNYAYDEPITITLIICGITLLSCAFSGAFKKIN